MTPSVAVVEEVVVLELCWTWAALSVVVEEEEEEVVAVAVKVGWRVAPAAGMARLPA